MRSIRFASALLVVLMVPWTGPAAAAARIPHGRLGVGDSIMLSASDELAAFEIPVAAKVGRQFSEGLRIVRARAKKGTLPKRVIVHLGTNGWIDPADCEALVVSARSHRRVFLVTIRVPRDWMEPNNLTLKACAEAHAKVHLIGWARVSGRHPEWFAEDGYHLNPLGQDKYAAYLDARVDAILASVLGPA
jgi:lysophospholipase L1-like esterase